MDFSEALNPSFLKLAVQYYIAARSAALAGLMPVSGNLYHHAIEMFLKAQLSQAKSLEVLKNRLGHDLSALWQSFKGDFLTISFEQFNDTIASLCPFENIRYPENMIKEGAQMAIIWNKSPFLTGSLLESRVPRYEICVNDIDLLVARIFEVCSKNPLFFMATLNEYGRNAILHKNPASDTWSSPIPVIK